ncbi:MAG: cysteine hydrolase family protein [Desulfobulbus sp.]|jgi:nicotinamidase-related amidase
MSDSHDALLIIDMQNDFVLPGAPACIRGAQATVSAIRRLLDRFRARNRPVFHIIRTYRADGSDIEWTRLAGFRKQPYLLPGTEGCAIVDELMPLPGEYQIIKQRFSAFMQTELDLMLRRLHVDEVVVCGTQYPVCIRATLMDALALGYRAVSVTDATSAQTPEVAAANITDLKNMGVLCCTVDELGGK